MDISEERTYRDVSYGFFGGLLAAFGTAILINVIDPRKFIPDTKEVQAGYVAPGNLEIKLKDLNGDGQNETILGYNGENYLFLVDEHGNPRVQAYEVKPAEVVPKPSYKTGN